MSNLSPVTGSPLSVKNEESSPPKPSFAQTNTTKPNKPKSRKRVNTAEKRHQHNAIERQRRETLNGKFLSLARLLPSLASHRRPSKSAIVNGSISHLTHQRNQRLLAAKLLRQICTERDELLAEVNEWRKASGFVLKDTESAWTQEMDEIVKVESETFGTFASVGGDNGDEDGNENENENENDDEDRDQSLEMNIERASVIASNFGSNGLITPRASAELDSASHISALYANVAGVVPTQQQSAMMNQSGSNGWSSDFVFGINNQQGPQNQPSNVAFNAFMSDSHSSSASPLSFHGSVSAGNQTGTILTPPATTEMGFGITHTPSPRSSTSGGAGVEDVKSVPSQAQNQWANQQMLFLQHQVQQQNLQKQQQQSAFNAASFLPGFGAGNNANSTASGNGNGNGNGFQLPNLRQQQQPNVNDAFTQSIMASMFPAQRDLGLNALNSFAAANQGNGNGMGAMGMGMTAEQVQQWRHLAIGGLMQHGQGGRPMSMSGIDQPTIDDLKNAVRHGMGLGLGMSTLWNENQHTVEGF